MCLRSWYYFLDPQKQLLDLGIGFKQFIWEMKLLISWGVGTEIGKRRIIQNW